MELSTEDSAVVASAERAGINVAALRVTDVRTTDSGKKIYARQTADFVCPAGVCHGGGEAVSSSAGTFASCVWGRHAAAQTT